MTHLFTAHSPIKQHGIGQLQCTDSFTQQNMAAEVERQGWQSTSEPLESVSLAEQQSAWRFPFETWVAHHNTARPVDQLFQTAVSTEAMVNSSQLCYTQHWLALCAGEPLWRQVVLDGVRERQWRRMAMFIGCTVAAVDWTENTILDDKAGNASRTVRGFMCRTQ